MLNKLPEDTHIPHDSFVHWINALIEKVNELEKWQREHNDMTNAITYNSGCIAEVNHALQEIKDKLPKKEIDIPWKRSRGTSGR